MAVRPLVPRPRRDGLDVALGLDAHVQVGLQRDEVVGTTDGADAGHDERRQLAEVTECVRPGEWVAVEAVRRDPERGHGSGEEHIGVGHQHDEVLALLSADRHGARRRREPRCFVHRVRHRPGGELLVECVGVGRVQASGRRARFGGWSSRALVWARPYRAAIQSFDDPPTNSMWLDV